MAETPEEVARRVNGMYLDSRATYADCRAYVTRALRAQYVAGLEAAARDAETYCPLNASVSALILQREIAIHIRELAEQAKEK